MRRALRAGEWAVTVSPHVVVYEIDYERDELIVNGIFRNSQQFRRP